jgi:hypothetical protein
MNNYAGSADTVSSTSETASESQKSPKQLQRPAKPQENIYDPWTI